MISWKMLALPLLASAFLVSCTATYDPLPDAANHPPEVLLDEAKPVLVTTPTNGHYQTAVYDNSGIATADETGESFARYASKVTVSPDAFSSIKDLRRTIAKSNYGYVVVPTITHWEQRATAWSGRPSRASVKITVLDAKTGEELSSTEVDGKSASFTFLSTRPADLLPGLIDPYVNALYGVTPQASGSQ